MTRSVRRVGKSDEVRQPYRIEEALFLRRSVVAMMAGAVAGLGGAMSSSSSKAIDIHPELNASSIDRIRVWRVAQLLMTRSQIDSLSIRRHADYIDLYVGAPAFREVLDLVFERKLEEMWPAECEIRWMIDFYEKNKLIHSCGFNYDLGNPEPGCGFVNGKSGSLSSDVPKGMGHIVEKNNLIFKRN